MESLYQDLYNLIFDYLCQYDILRLTLVSRFMKKRAKKYISNTQLLTIESKQQLFMAYKYKAAISAKRISNIYLISLQPIARFYGSGKVSISVATAIYAGALISGDVSWFKKIYNQFNAYRVKAIQQQQEQDKQYKQLGSDEREKKRLRKDTLDFWDEQLYGDISYGWSLRLLSRCGNEINNIYGYMKEVEQLGIFNLKNRDNQKIILRQALKYCDIKLSKNIMENRTYDFDHKTIEYLCKKYAVNFVKSDKLEDFKNIVKYVANKFGIAILEDYRNTIYYIHNSHVDYDRIVPLTMFREACYLNNEKFMDYLKGHIYRGSQYDKCQHCNKFIHNHYYNKK